MMIGTNTGSNETWKLIPEGSIGVELGVWKGDTSIKFLKRAKHLHLVDSWSVQAYESSDELGDYDGYLDKYSKIVGSRNPNDFQKFYDDIANDVKIRFKDYSVTIHRISTEQFFKNCDFIVDWVYVDASHSYDGCFQDLQNCLSIIKSGGTIFGDDYGNKKGVTNAVKDFILETHLPFNNFFSNQYRIDLL